MNKIIQCKSKKVKLVKIGDKMPVSTADYTSVSKICSHEGTYLITFSNGYKRFFVDGNRTMVILK